MRASNDRALLVGRPLGGRFGTDPAGTAAEAKALGAILLEAKILTRAQLKLKADEVLAKDRRFPVTDSSRQEFG